MSPKKMLIPFLEKLYEAGAGAMGNYDQCSFVTPGKGSFRGNENSKPYLGKPMIREEVEEVQLNLVFQKHLEQKILQTLFENHPYEAVAFELHQLDNQNSEIGMGSVGILKEEMTEEDFLKWLGQKLETNFLRHSPLPQSKNKKSSSSGRIGKFCHPQCKTNKSRCTGYCRP